MRWTTKDERATERAIGAALTRYFFTDHPDELLEEFLLPVLSAEAARLGALVPHGLCVTSFGTPDLDCVDGWSVELRTEASADFPTAVSVAVWRPTLLAAVQLGFRDWVAITERVRDTLEMSRTTRRP